eukprot:505857-Pyramimonas_sp.AAC.1
MASHKVSGSATASWRERNAWRRSFGAAPSHSSRWNDHCARVLGCPTIRQERVRLGRTRNIREILQERDGEG